jgi:hypothetical protein
MAAAGGPGVTACRGRVWAPGQHPGPVAGPSGKARGQWDGRPAGPARNFKSLARLTPHRLSLPVSAVRGR